MMIHDDTPVKYIKSPYLLSSGFGYYQFYGGDSVVIGPRVIDAIMNCAGVFGREVLSVF